MMPSFSPELISTMRAVLDDVMTHIPVDQATSGIKVRLARLFYRRPPSQTSYELLYAAAFSQIQAVLSLFT